MSDFNLDDLGEGSSTPLLGRITSLLPLGMIILLAMGNALFCATSIFPQWQTHEELSSQIATAQAAVTASAAEQSGLDNLTVLEAQIESAQNALIEAGSQFIPAEQVDPLLGRLYDYARAVGVEIDSLQTQQVEAEPDVDPYAVQIFQLKVSGPIPGLMAFVTQVREAALPSILIEAVNLQTANTTPELLLTLSVFTSPFAPPDALENLPTINAPELLIAATTPVPSSSTTAVETAPDSAPLVHVYGTEPPLDLVFSDTFDGTLAAWQLGDGWALITNTEGQMLQVTDSVEPVTLVHDPLLDSAAQARFLLERGSARLSIRQSAEGSYTVVLDPSGQVALYRSGVLIQSANTAPSAIGRWRTLRLSAVEGIVRVAVDEVERIGFQDTAQLPPGTVSFALIGNGQVRVDDVSVWSRESPG